MFATFAIVIVGIAKLATNKKAIDHKKSNKLMVMRVVLQAIVITILSLMYFIKR